MSITTEEVRVYDLDGLLALPVGTRLHSAIVSDFKEDPQVRRWWELHEDGLWYRHGSDDTVTRKGYKPSRIMFVSVRGRPMSRRILNPEVLGEFQATADA